MEVEARVKVESLEDIKKKLVDMGAEFFEPKKQNDAVFKRKDLISKVAKPGDFILRIRQSTKNILTFKALTDRAGVWIEHETEIKDSEQLRSILEKTGFIEQVSMHKTRIPGTLGDFELCLDDIEELGTYIEIALDSEDGNDAKEKIIGLLNKLGFAEKDIVHKGYVAMLFERLGVVMKGTG
ncbi:MAG: class IV adenylate cyclase [archaeon]